MLLSLAQQSIEKVQSTNWDWSWDLIIKAFGLLGVIGGFIGVILSIQKYLYEKNRDVFIKRLNEVYAPLYGLISKQEIMRRLYFPQVTLEEAPIITTVNRKSTQKIEFKENSDVKVTGSSSESVGILDRKQFINALNEANKGLARPNLLKLINEYEVLVYLEETLDSEDDKWMNATSEKVKVELMLIKEIVYGYKEAVAKLGLDDDHSISMADDILNQNH